MLTETVVVLPAETPLWQILLQLLAPLAAVAIAVGGVLRDNRIRRKLAGDALRKEAELALIRARRVLDSCQGNTLSGGGMAPQQITTFTIENTNDAPIYDVQLTDAVMEGAPMGASWRPGAGDGYIQHIAPGGSAQVTGNWWRPGGNGDLEPGQLSSGNPGQVHPIMNWHDENGRRFAKGATGTVTAVDELE
ncbi:hypothetical protein [Leifsonia aquatica]|uniref:hypothetical protein n=1 Tax=Leifsonia aquatica TaxID=144185 RepID=UPI0038257731